MTATIHQLKPSDPHKECKITIDEYKENLQQVLSTYNEKGYITTMDALNLNGLASRAMSLLISEHDKLASQLSERRVD